MAKKTFDELINETVNKNQDSKEKKISDSVVVIEQENHSQKIDDDPIGCLLCSIMEALQKPKHTFRDVRPERLTDMFGGDAEVIITMGGPEIAYNEDGMVDIFKDIVKMLPSGKKYSSEDIKEIRKDKSKHGASLKKLLALMDDNHVAKAFNGMQLFKEGGEIVYAQQGTSVDNPTQLNEVTVNYQWLTPDNENPGSFLTDIWEDSDREFIKRFHKWRKAPEGKEALKGLSSFNVNGRLIYVPTKSKRYWELANAQMNSGSNGGGKSFDERLRNGELRPTGTVDEQGKELYTDANGNAYTAYKNGGIVNNEETYQIEYAESGKKIDDRTVTVRENVSGEMVQFEKPDSDQAAGKKIIHSTKGDGFMINGKFYYAKNIPNYIKKQEDGGSVEPAVKIQAGSTVTEESSRKKIKLPDAMSEDELLGKKPIKTSIGFVVMQANGTVISVDKIKKAEEGTELSNNKETVKIGIGDKEYDLWEAKTDEEKEQGLQGVEKLDDNQGMIFYYDKPQTLQFWMKDTEIPLTICFFNEDEECIAVKQGHPLDETLIECKDAMFVVELNDNADVKPGDVLDLPGDDDEYVMSVLGSDGEVQYGLKGGERIFSRKSTKIMIKKAKRAYKNKNVAGDFYNRACRSLGKYVFKELDAQDGRDPEYVSLDKDK